MSKTYKGDVTGNVVELNLLDAIEGTLPNLGTSTVLTLSSGPNVVHQIQGDITSQKVQDGVNSGGGYGNNTNLKGLVIGTSCTNIGSGSFYFFEGLTGDLVIPDSVTAIGDNSYASAVFAGCTYGPNLTIGRNVQLIGDWSFGLNSNLTNVNCYISKTVIDENDQVFIGSTNIATVHARVSDSTWTAGTNQYIGGIYGIEVIKDLV